VESRYGNRCVSLATKHDFFACAPNLCGGGSSQIVFRLGSRYAASKVRIWTEPGAQRDEYGDGDRAGGETVVHLGTQGRVDCTCSNSMTRPAFDNKKCFVCVRKGELANDSRLGHCADRTTWSFNKLAPRDCHRFPRVGTLSEGKRTMTENSSFIDHYSRLIRSPQARDGPS